MTSYAHSVRRCISNSSNLPTHSHAGAGPSPPPSPPPSLIPSSSPSLRLLLLQRTRSLATMASATIFLTSGPRGSMQPGQCAAFLAFEGGGPALEGAGRFIPRREEGGRENEERGALSLKEREKERERRKVAFPPLPAPLFLALPSCLPISLSRLPYDVHASMHPLQYVCPWLQ